MYNKEKMPGNYRLICKLRYFPFYSLTSFSLLGFWVSLEFKYAVSYITLEAKLGFILPIIWLTKPFSSVIYINVIVYTIVTGYLMDFTNDISHIASMWVVCLTRESYTIHQLNISVCNIKYIFIQSHISIHAI